MTVVRAPAMQPRQGHALPSSCAICRFQRCLVRRAGGADKYRSNKRSAFVSRLHMFKRRSQQGCTQVAESGGGGSAIRQQPPVER